MSILTFYKSSTEQNLGHVKMLGVKGAKENLESYKNHLVIAAIVD